MDSNRQYLLKIHRSTITMDLRVDDVIDKLLSSKALSLDDYELIKDEKKEKEKARKLLDIISKGDDDTYDSFVSSLKDYYEWIWSKLQINQTSIPADVLNENVEDGLSRGEVPKLPIHYVSRSILENDLCQSLVNLKRHNVLLVHGMPGSGKSSLVIGTLRNNPKLIIETFKGNVFWINVGECKSGDKTLEKIMQLQTRVLRRITPDEITLNTSTSILSFNSMCSSFYEPDWEDHKDKLKKSFEEINLREALLIIDDLKDKTVIDAFNIGCKILITTQDSKLAEEHSSFTFNVPAFLTEQESLQLISISINQPINKLPQYAKDMHNICKGSPLLMSMLGGMLAENKESLQHDKKRWKYFVKQLKNKSKFIDHFSFGKPTNDTFLAVEVCLNSLKDEGFIQKYKLLVILPENIKVSIEALSTIFAMPVEEVEKFMKLLKTKSLIIEHYHVDQKKYQYEVHDLIMSYLQHIHNCEEINKLHVHLLNEYMKKTPDLIDLPDDGYIAYYVGYHIYHTNNLDNMWSLFPNLYTNLEFVGNKTRLTGPSSVMDDLKYFVHVKESSNYNEDYIESLRKFISNHGHDLHRYPNTDILQSIFQHEGGGVLYDEALKLAKENDYRSHLYLQFQYDQSEDINYSTIHIDEILHIVRFWQHYIFVGNESGSITLWSINAYNKLMSFIGHKAAIKSISINNIAPFKMASTCSDGILRIWNIDNLNNNMNDGFSDSDGEDNFQDYYNLNESEKIQHPSGRLCNISWGRNSNILLTHTNPGSTLILYSAKRKVQKHINIGEDNKISSSILSMDDSLAIVGFYSVSNKQHIVHLYSTKSYDLLITFTETDEIKMLSLIPNVPKRLFVLTKTYFQVHKWNQEVISNSIQAIQNVSTSKVTNKEINSQNDYIFQTAVIGKESYLFIATTDCHILVYNLLNCMSLGVLNNHRGNVITMDVMEYNSDPNSISSHILVTASGREQLSLKLWCVDPSQFSSNIIRKPIFDCIFNPLQELPVKINHCREKSDPSTLRRAETIQSPDNAQKMYLRKTLSLDKKHLKIMTLKCMNQETANLPLIAVADSSNCVQVIKGKNLIGKTCKASSIIKCVALSPCGHYLSYGMENGNLVIFSLKTMSGNIVMQIREHVNYVEFLNSNTLVVAGKDNCLMLYEIYSHPNNCIAKMIVSSKYDLGSQELLDTLSGKRKTPELNGSNNNGSPVSDSSTSSLIDYPIVNHKRVHRSSEKSLHKYSPTIKCFLLGKELLSISRDGSVKLWNSEPNLVAVLVGKQDMCLSCVNMRKNYLVLCDGSGVFQIYLLYNIDKDSPIEAKCITQYHTSEKITCCNISHDNKILAMGCSSGNIVLWHILDKMLISIQKFHKIAVQYLDFSPTPVECNLSLIGSRNEIQNDNSTPLVLMSLAGQVAWWNVSHIIKKKKDFLNRQERGSIHSPLAALSLSDVNSKTGESSIFKFPTNTSWEKLWCGKKCKNKFNRKELLACIKLKGERALKIKTDDSFSSFITVDQGGVLYIMNILRNNENQNETSPLGSKQ